MTRSAGLYWLLETGRNETRRSLSLGYVTETEAGRALESLQAAEESGDATRILAWHARSPEDAAKAIRYLVGDPGKPALIPSEVEDFRTWTLRRYFDEKFREHRAAHRPRAWKAEQSHWRRILASPLAEARLGELASDNGPRIVFKWLRDLKAERSGGVRRGKVRTEGAYVPDGAQDRPASGAYRRLLRSALQALLKHAHIESPDGCVVPDVDLSTLPIEGSTRATRKRSDPLTVEELAAVLDAADAKHRALFAVGAGEGLRPSELARLEWPHVRWTSRTLFVPGSKTAESAAEIPLTPVAYRELRAWWTAQGEPTEGPIFVARWKVEDGRKVPLPYGESGYKRALATAARNAGISRPVTPYLLRHSFATIAVAAGVPEDTARRMLRHTDPSMIRKVYNRPSAGSLVESASAFDLE